MIIIEILIEDMTVINKEIVILRGAHHEETGKAGTGQQAREVATPLVTVTEAIPREGINTKTR